jgi:hypothetical protein
MPSISFTDREFRLWVASMSLHLEYHFSDVPLFTTNAGPTIYDMYLHHFPEHPSGDVVGGDYYTRAQHKCNACQIFIEKYGSLVTLDKRGSVTPIMWDIWRTPGTYRRSISAIYDYLKYSSSITGVFYDTSKVWGVSPNHEGTQYPYHFHVIPPPCPYLSQPPY